jgi:hypothetical protein
MRKRIGIHAFVDLVSYCMLSGIEVSRKFIKWSEHF